MTEVAPVEAGVGEGNWQNGLLGCFGNFGLCIKAFVCPCLVFSGTAEAIGKSKCVWCVFFFIPVWNVLKAVSLRGQIRDKRGIPGGFCGDCLFTLLCGPCALIQEAREVSEMEPMDMARE